MCEISTEINQNLFILKCIYVYTMESKIVQKFGNSGHVVLPKDYVGKKIRFIAETKTFEDIKS